jgi:hypothetical protein
MIIFKEPRTHIQTFFLPWSLLAALGFFNFHNLLSKLKNPSLKRICRLVFVSIFSLVIFISTGYIYKVFIKHEPEYIWDHCPESKLRYGLFGFPYHRGWKTVGYLFRTQKLNGTYASNEKGRITHFYLRQAIVKKSQNPKYVIFSKNPQSWKKKFGIPNSFKLSAQIFVSGKPMIDIYENPKSAGKLQTYRSEEYDKFYDELDKTIP